MASTASGQPGIDGVAFLRIAKALSDPNRLEILERVGAEGNITCADLLGSFSISQATMSHHLRELREAGLFDCAGLSVGGETESGRPRPSGCDIGVELVCGRVEVAAVTHRVNGAGPR